MSGRVGAEGNIVIEKSIRDRLGVEPGWETIQLLRGGHVEVHFLPPVRPGASAGILGPASDESPLQDDESLHATIEEAVELSVRERFAPADGEPFA